MTMQHMLALPLRKKSRCQPGPSNGLLYTNKNEDMAFMFSNAAVTTPAAMATPAAAAARRTASTASLLPAQFHASLSDLASPAVQVWYFTQPMPSCNVLCFNQSPTTVCMTLTTGPRHAGSC